MNALTLDIRPARPAELDAVGELTVRAYRRDGLAPPRYEPVLADASGRARDARVLVALAGEALAGTVTLVPPGSALREIAAPAEDELRMLAVDPSHRGAGIGAALIRSCQDGRWREPGRALVASSSAAMTTAHRLYARLGFLRNPSRDWQPYPGLQLLVFEWQPGAGMPREP